jgi:hypothetical protein
MDAIAIRRRSLGRPRCWPGRAMADKAHSSAGKPRLAAAAQHQGGCSRQGRSEVATRYGKRERIYQGTIDVASIRIWLRDPVQ